MGNTTEARPLPILPPAYIKDNMTAQSIERPRAKRKTYKDSDTKARKIVALAVHSNAPPTDIAAIVKTSRQNVHQTLKRYGIDTKDLESYKDRRAEILTGIQAKLLKSVDDTVIQKASLNNIAYAFSQFHNAERLETGQTTGNIGVGIALSEPMQAAVERIITRSTPVDNPQIIDVDSAPLIESTT
jgi:hypothetical protein